MKFPPVALPRFAQRFLYERVSCPHCYCKIEKQHVRFVGAGRAKGGIICFSYQYECPGCRRMQTVLDTSRPFSVEDWWIELTKWHDDAAPFEPTNIDQREARRMPKVGPMVLDMVGLESVWIRGGYKGEVGPVLFIYEGTEPNSSSGFLRLQRESAVSLFDHSDVHCLPRSEIGRFAVAAEGSMFELDGRQWTKMSATEIEEIVRDRVFKVTLNDNDPVTTGRAKTCRAYGSAHSPKSGKRTRRPPRNSRPMDS